MNNLSALGGLVLMLAAVPVLTDEAEPPVPVEPQQLEISTPTVPVQMLAEDAATLRERQAVRSSERRGASAGTAAERPGGVSRTVHIHSASTTLNATSRFKFRDVTERGASGPALTLQQRRGAVDALRHSLLGGG